MKCISGSWFTHAADVVPSEIRFFSSWDALAHFRFRTRLPANELYYSNISVSHNTCHRASVVLFPLWPFSACWWHQFSPAQQGHISDQRNEQHVHKFTGHRAKRSNADKRSIETSKQILPTPPRVALRSWTVANRLLYSCLAFQSRR